MGGVIACESGSLLYFRCVVEHLVFFIEVDLDSDVPLPMVFLHLHGKGFGTLISVLLLFLKPPLQLPLSDCGHWWLPWLD